MGKETLGKERTRLVPGKEAHGGGGGGFQVAVASR